MSERTAVYRVFDAEDVLLYVGVSKNFGRRWQQHTSAKPWWPEVKRQTVEWHDEETALRIEVEAIERERPRYNVARTNSHYRSRRSEPRGPQPYMGSAEIGRALDVSRQRVQQLAAQPDFPEPYDILAAGKVWKRADVEAWAKANGRTLED